MPLRELIVVGDQLSYIGLDGLPPAPAPKLAGALSVPVLDLPNGQVFATKPYRSGLSLDRMVQPYVSAGGGATGGFVRAGVGLSFADMLGDRAQSVMPGNAAADFDPHFGRWQIDLVVKHGDGIERQFVEMRGFADRAPGLVHESAGQE